MAMKWRGGRQSENVEHDRSGGRTPRRGGAQVGGLGLVIVVVLGLLFGVDVTPFLQGADPGATATTQPVERTAEDREAEAFVSTVLAFTEDAWKPIFQRQIGEPYRPAVLKFFRGQTMSGCGQASAATGPFYCPADQKVYIDTDFFLTLQQELGAGGDFAAAYVVAHEVAHHVQNLLGILGQVNQIRQRSSEAVSNGLSVRIELQADCLSGLWAKSMEQRFGVLEPGDIEEAVNAAKRIGDDVLMQRAGQRPQPHMFTHGSAAQRSRWFVTGYRSGDVNDCNTFEADQL
jgi:predicted metalloprotease